MNAVTENIRVSIDRLTHLLQLSLGPYSPENARLLTKTIVDLIDHATKLSMETNDLINEHKKREHELCSCLVEMDTLVKRQRKKLQAVPTKALTRDVDTNTVDVTCSMCRTHEGTIANLKATVDDLNEKNGVLQGKFVQSKCLIQAQQVSSKDLLLSHRNVFITSTVFHRFYLRSGANKKYLSERVIVPQKVNGNKVILQVRRMSAIGTKSWKRIKITHVEKEKAHMYLTT